MRAGIDACWQSGELTRKAEAKYRAEEVCKGIAYLRHGKEKRRSGEV